MFDFLSDVPSMGDMFGGGGGGGGGLGGGVVETGLGGGGGLGGGEVSGSGSSGGGFGDLLRDSGIGRGFGGFDDGGLGAGSFGDIDLGVDIGGLLRDSGIGRGFGGFGGPGGMFGGDDTQKLDFVANDGSLGLDMFAWLTGHDQDRPRNIYEMAAAAEAARADGGAVSQIDLVGHGHDGWQSTGRDDEAGGSVSANMSAADRDAFRRMGATMTPDGEIVFGGCNVAADNGAMMAQAAAAAGHAVRGGTARQIPFRPGIEGPEVVVNPDGSMRTETNWFKDAYAWADNHVPW